MLLKLMNRCAAGALACSALLCALPSPVRAWGASAHRMVSRLGIESLPQDLPAFLRSDEALWQIGELGREADRSKGAGAAHDADLDPGHRIALGDDRNVSGLPLDPLPPTREAYDTALRARGSDEYRAGYLPYAIIEGWQQLRIDLAYWRIDAVGERTAESADDRAWFARDRRLREALTLRDLGYWSHFVADASQPLHVSVHFMSWGEFPNPEGYSTSPALHAHVEGAFVAGFVTADDVRTRLRPYRDCGCAIAERTVAYILATQAQVVPLYALEKRNAFDGTHREGQDFVAERLAAAASELRDMIADAWRSSADAAAGYPGIKVRDVESGRALPIEALKGID